MNMIKVISSQIKEIGYDEKKQKLIVRFNNGNKLYRYDSVPPSVYDDLMEAESHGGFFNSYIRTKFQYRPIEEHEIES